MALKVWLPLTGTLENKGISNSIATNVGATIDNSGKIGKCYSLAQGNHIDIDINNVNNHKYPLISVACWVYFTQADSTQRYIIDCLESGGCGLCWQDQKIEWAVYVNGYKRCWSEVITLNQWHHICGTYNGTTSSIYIDGILQNTLTANGSLTYHSTCPWEIGGNPGAKAFSSGNLTGKLNDVRIYNHCLSALEVKEISQGLILHYKMDDGWSFAGENLLMKTTMTPTERTNDFVANSSTDFTKQIRYYNGSDSNHTFTESLDGSYQDTVLLNSNSNLGIAFVRLQSDIQLNSSKYYTLSCQAKCTNTARQLAIGTSYYTTANAWVWRGGNNARNFTATNTWQTFSITFKPDSNIQAICYCFTVKGTNNGKDTFTIRHCKLEEGSVATPWVPEKTESWLPITKIVDSSGYGNEGVIVGSPSFKNNNTEGRYFSSLNFNVNNDSITLPPCFSVGQTQTELTTAIWAKANTLNSTTPNLISLGENGFWRFRLASTSSIWYYIRVGSTQCSATFSKSGINLIDNNWHFYAITFKNGYIKVYLDGELIGTSNHSGAGVVTTCNQAASSWHLAGYTANSENFIGSLSDARIYVTALSDEDIATLYHTSAHVDNLGGIHGFKFVENQGKISIQENGLILNEELDEINFDVNAQFMKETKNIVSNIFIEK